MYLSEEGFPSTHNIKQSKTNLPKKRNQTRTPTSERILVPWFGTNFSKVMWMSKALLLQIPVNLVVHLFCEKRILVNGTLPPPRDTELPFDMTFITMFYTCLVTEVVYHRREKHRIRV